MTHPAATAALSPEPPGSGLRALADDTTETITWGDFRAWERQMATTGTCSHPIRLHGRIEAIDRTTGEIAPVYDTTAEPGGVLHVASGNRRESVCPACSQVYKRDARQLVRAGLAGGKGVPEAIAAHPCVFATLTAPSFGPVHSRRMRGRTVLPCRPRRDANTRRCPHGRDISCPTRHIEDDPRLGRPMCGDCYDYQAAVLFNASAGDLWRRFTTYLPRHLARLSGIRQKTLDAQLRLRYVKVAEYQAGASSTTTPLSGWTRQGRTTNRPRPGTPPRCWLRPSPRPPAPCRSLLARRPHPSGSGSARKPTPGPSATPASCPPLARTCRYRRSPTTSPSTPPNP